MVRMVAESGAFERYEPGHFAGRALEHSGFAWPAQDPGLRRRGLDRLKEADRVLVGPLAQEAPDNEGDGQSPGGIGKLGDGVDADPDRPA